MQKLKLNVEDLRVEAFEANAPDEDIEGTVLGNAATLICSEKRSCGHICP